MYKRDESVDLTNLNLVELLECLLDHRLGSVHVNEEDKGVELFNLMHG